MPAKSSSLSLLWHVFVAGQQVRQLLVAAMGDSPLRPDEYAVYSALFDLGAKPPSELATLLGMPPTTMSHYVRAMVERGHARRARAAHDGRSFLLELTDEGRATHRAAGAAFARADALLRAQLEVDPAFLERALGEIGAAAARALAELKTAERQAAG
jgi:DNA-binding MarR family transcriptional regulator